MKNTILSLSALAMVSTCANAAIVTGPFPSTPPSLTGPLSGLSGPLPSFTLPQFNNPGETLNSVDLFGAGSIDYFLEVINPIANGDITGDADFTGQLSLIPDVNGNGMADDTEFFFLDVTQLNNVSLLAGESTGDLGGNITDSDSFLLTDPTSLAAFTGAGTITVFLGGSGTVALNSLSGTILNNDPADYEASAAVAYDSSPIPEPSSALALGLLCGLGMMTRRRR